MGRDQKPVEIVDFDSRFLEYFELYKKMILKVAPEVKVELIGSAAGG